MMERNFTEVIQTEIARDSLLISVGLPGSWKSPVTEEIAVIKGFDLLRTDLIRLEVLKGLDVFDGQVASDPENRKRVYEEMFRRAEKALEVEGRTDGFFRRREDLLYRRIASGRIRDCHGDLRLEHIFWGDEIAIFDCIEFNERFRYTDVAADIAFLAMDLDYQGREDLSWHLIQSAVEQSGDQELLDVLDFYKCYRAYVRGKVESFRLDDPGIPEEEKKRASERARKYFQLSYNYAKKF